jgi:hypothetical protein
MNDILELPTDVWQEVTLKFPTGKAVRTKYGPRALFTVIDAAGDERVLFLSPAEGAKLDNLRLGPGERVEVARIDAKNGQRHYKDFQCKRVDPPAENRPEPTAPSPGNGNGAVAPVRNIEKAGGSPAKGQSTTAPPAKDSGNGHATHNGVPYWDAKTELLQCYKDAIDVLVVVREDAARQGLPVQFTGEDLRQVAATLYIDAGKNRRCPNGGAR